MEEYKKISVIIPVYNVEKYLHKCVDSIINQTYSNLEIILVDDGSPDTCPKICDDYKRQDDRIKVVHKKNGGLSSARNVGLDIATGEFVCFCDSDDYFEERTVEILYKTIIEKNAQIVQMKSYIVDEDYNIVCCQASNTMSINVSTSNEVLKDIFCRKYSESVCDKMFFRKTIGNVRFREGGLNEDFLFLTTILLNEIIFADIDYAGYNYYSRDDSITSKSFGKSLIDSVYNSFEVLEKIKSKKAELIAYSGAYLVYQARTALVCMPKEYREQNKEFEDFCIECLKQNLRYASFKQFKLKDIIFCKLYIKKPNLARKILLIRRQRSDNEKTRKNNT